MYYEEELKIKLLKTRAPVTVEQYIKRLRVLNDNQPIKNLKFLLESEDVLNKIESLPLSFSTKTSYLTAISATLSLFPKFKKLYKVYQAKMISNANQIKEEYSKNELNDKQKESIVPMSEIIKVREEFKEKDGWMNLVTYVLISLYTMTPPRRNEYALMYIVMDAESATDESRNYYIASTAQFLFHNYKTKKVYGKQLLDVPDELKAVLDNYIEKYIEKFNPLDDEFPLLVSASGKMLNKTNGITNVLNKAFGKNIGSSALRHIFISDKYGDGLKERKGDSLAMGHSLSTQMEYCKTDVGAQS